MHRKQYYYFIVLFTSALAKEPELPLCPTNILQYFPQNLPMHCRLPSNLNFPGLPDPAQFPTMPPFYQSPPPEIDPPLPVPVPPAVPGGMPMLPGPHNMPMMPMPMPLPMPLASNPSQKLPVIVMPLYSPDPNFRKPQRPQMPGPRPRPKFRPRPRHKYDIYKRPSIHSESDSDTDTSSDESGMSSRGKSSERGFWKGSKRGYRRSGRRASRKHKHKVKADKKEKLTPILQYVTKEGYVIYEKAISKDEAKDWLSTKKREENKETKNVDNSTPEEAFNGSLLDEKDEEIVQRTENRREILETITRKPLVKSQSKQKSHKKHSKLPKELGAPRMQ